MTDIEYILDFAASLGSKMLSVGANLERVNDTMYRICHSYHLHSISIFSISSLIILGAKSEDDKSGTRQVSIHSTSTHLEKLNRFNQLSRKVCSQTPPPDTLAGLLAEAEQVKDSPPALIILGHLLSVTTLCAMYGGSFADIFSVSVNTFVLYWISEYFDKRNINQIIITNSLMMIPSISLVNAVRNVLCGNEMNGILEFLKVVLESLAIVLGVVLSIYLFGGQTIQWQKV